MNLSYLRFKGLGRAKRFVGRSDSGWDYLTFSVLDTRISRLRTHVRQIWIKLLSSGGTTNRQIYHATFY